MDRSLYHKKLNEHLKKHGLTYHSQGSKMVDEDFFKILWEVVDKERNKTRTDLAIERAKRNYNRFDHSNPGKEESSTTVHELVLELKMYI